MKKRLTLIVALFSLSVMLFGCGANAETEKDTNSSNKVEETTGTNSDLETEGQSGFTYDFEGRYWVAYEEEYSLGYYFDGTNAAALVTVGSENITPYSVKNGKIMFTYESGEIFEYVYHIEDDCLYLLASDESLEICCVEVDKAEFDRLFNGDIHSEEASTTEVETETVMEEPTTEEINTEAQNNFTYDFEGRYWVEYGEYSNGGYYFVANFTKKYIPKENWNLLEKSKLTYEDALELAENVIDNIDQISYQEKGNVTSLMENGVDEDEVIEIVYEDSSKMRTQVMERYITNFLEQSGVDRRIYTKYMKNPLYQPNKKLALAIGLFCEPYCNLEDTDDIELAIVENLERFMNQNSLSVKSSYATITEFDSLGDEEFLYLVEDGLTIDVLAYMLRNFARTERDFK